MISMLAEIFDIFTSENASDIIRVNYCILKKEDFVVRKVKSKKNKLLNKIFE